MSTRCQIGFYNPKNTNISKPDILIYRHNDGYPGNPSTKQYGVVTSILPFLKEFNKQRDLTDIEYCSAQLLFHMIGEHSNGGKYKPVDTRRYLSYGICAKKDFHGDIEYYYVIRGNKLIVYKCGWDQNPKDYKEIDSYTIE